MIFACAVSKSSIQNLNHRMESLEGQYYIDIFHIDEDI